MTGKGDRWEGDRQVGRSEPAFGVPAPLHSLHLPALHGERPANIIWQLLFCCEAGHLLVVVLLQGLCQSHRLPAVFACSGLVLRAMFACSPLPCHAHCPSHRLPRSFCFAPCPCPCAPGSPQASVCKLRELSRWQQQRGSAVAARAPHCIHPPFPVLQGLPCRHQRQGTAFVQTMRRCSLCPLKGEA